ncbi:guanylate cyclase activator 1C [Silurus meridionalis]|nr:guanylate cyclase activator 1C [Silurus meridionalis]
MEIELNDFKQSNNNDEDERRVDDGGQNGAHVIVPDMPDNPLAENTPVGTLSRLKKELQEEACWKVRVWMLILIILILIILVIFFSVYFCSVYQEDVDDKYNVADFVVPLFFRGHFTLLNKNLTLDTQSQSILKQKLTHIYNSSYALGRYFSLATVNALRDSSSPVEYELKFMMPEEHKLLKEFTLSKEMVYNVLLQQIYDQDINEPLRIVPTSLTMEVMGAHGSNLDEILAEDMHHWYNKFMRESPSGLITLFELKNMLQMQGMTEEASGYVDQVFYTFDMDGDGYIDFVEYIAAVSLLLKGEINQKLKWYFKLFDQDGNGKIDKDEMETIFKAIQDITRIYDDPPEDIVALIYERIDVNNEGELTLEEFITGAKDQPDIMEMLTKMMDLTHVLEIIVNGQKKLASV